MKRKLIAMTAAATAALFFNAMTTASADDADSFFKGKVIRIVVGSPAGGGYDINARALAHYFANHVPGQPTVIVQNQGGAGSLIMTNALYNTGSFDGLTIGAPLGGIVTAQLLQPDGVHFDARKLIWLGTTSQEVHVSYVWNTAPVKNFQDLLHTELIVGAQGPGATQWDYPMIANALLGTKFKIVSGYESTPQIHTAMERGEIMGNGGLSYTTLAAVSPEWLTEKKVNIVLQWGDKKIPALADVPRAYDLAKNDADRDVIKLAQVRLLFGKPFFVPPGVPADRVAVLRKAFDDTMKDPGFIAEEEKAHLDVDPLPGVAVTKALEEVYAAPPATADRLRGILSGK